MRLTLATLLVFTLGTLAHAAPTKPNARQRLGAELVEGFMVEGLMIEADLVFGQRKVSGKVLTDLASNQWVTIATEQNLTLQARAHLLESDVVEVETRVVGSPQDKLDQRANFIVRLGEPADMSVAEMEGSVVPNDKTPVASSTLKIKVRKVRYSR